MTVFGRGLSSEAQVHYFRPHFDPSIAMSLESPKAQKQRGYPASCQCHAAVAASTQASSCCVPISNLNARVCGLFSEAREC